MFRVPTRRALVFCPALATIAGAMGCDRVQPGSGPAGAAPGFIVRDSSGIEIIENHAPEHPPGQFWTIDAEPEIVLGGGGARPGEHQAAAQDPAQLIWEVAGIARLQDGRVAVLSQGNHQLYLFEPSGELSRVIGGRGEGPGEFVRPQLLQYLAPDTLAVWDYWFGGTSYFDTGGELIRERSFDVREMMEQAPGANAESRFHPLPDGSFVVMARGTPPASEPRPGSVVREPAKHYMRIGSSYSAQSLGHLEGVDEWYPEGGWDFPGFPTLRVDSYIAAGGDPPSIYLADGERNEIRQFSLDGTLVRIIRRTVAPVPVTETAHREWLEYLSLEAPLGDIEPQPGRTWEEFFAAIPRRESYPPVAGLVVDAEGYLWVREWSEDAQGGIPDQWSIFGPGGRWLGVVRGLPVYYACRWYFVPCWVDRDFLLTIQVDDLGVESVEGYRIRRGDGGP